MDEECYQIVADALASISPEGINKHIVVETLADAFFKADTCEEFDRYRFVLRSHGMAGPES